MADHNHHMAHGDHPTTSIPHVHAMHEREHEGHETTAMPGHDHTTMSHMMMYFHGGYTETILFDSWKIDSAGGLIGSMLGIFIMAALYEGLKYYREYLFWKTYSDRQYQAVTMPAEKSPEDRQQIGRPTMMSLPHVFQTVMHIVQIVLSYFLMLIFMTYNVWLCVAVVAGAAVGYFLFGWKKTVIMDVTEHCH